VIDSPNETKYLPPGKAEAAPRRNGVRDAVQHWIRRTRRRSVVGDMALVHLSFAILVCVIAVSSIRWTSHWMMEENLHKWVSQWVGELDGLGAALYVAPEHREFAKVEEFVDSIPEIAYVRYYTADGELLHSQFASNVELETPPSKLSRAQLEQLRVSATPDRPYSSDDSINAANLYRASTCIWANAIASDGLLGFELNADIEESKELLGFVELGLDFGRYEQRASRNILYAGIAIAFALFLMALVGRETMRQALRPLSRLAEPISKLAGGQDSSALLEGDHEEIAAINSALATTISTLQERDDKLRRLASTDPLTGLPSRHCFEEDLADEVLRTKDTGTTSLVLFVDLDEFKLVNDRIGHSGGDELLVRAAHCLKERLGESDILSRYGGDEFAVLARDISFSDASHLAEALVESLRDATFIQHGEALQLSGSVGGAMIEGARYNPEELLRQADQACHKAKSHGRNRHHIYVESGDRRQCVASDMGWSQRIRDALRNDEFVLHYQPIQDLSSGKAELHEVLIRMKDRGDEIIQPGAFLPAANRFGMMVEIDYWVIRNALAALHEFRQENPEVRLALNLSGLVFEHDGLLDFVREQLELNSVPPSAVVFEVTEQVAIRYIADAGKMMRELKDLGCGFALDDFGAGFSSFNYLKRLPMDYLKIDGSFIENISNDPIDQAMVRSMVQIANAVNMQTIAEHVRDEQSLELLRDLGVDLAQGYYLGEPTAILAGSPAQLDSVELS
jgi:diguanylate cyclase (GGDEF)-like protein